MWNTLLGAGSNNLASAGEGAAQAINGAIVGAIIFFVFLVIALVVLMLIATWKIYVKAGRPGWNALVPVYSTVIMLEFLSMPLWLIIIALLPYASIAVWIVMAYRLAKAFGKGAWFTAGIILLPFIFYPILAFGRSQYQKELLPTGINEATKWTLIGSAVLGILYSLSAFLPAFLGGTGGLSIINSDLAYSTDGRYVYQYDYVIPGADPDSFAILNEYYAADHNSVFYNGSPIQGANASSFELLGTYGYAQDHRHGYYDGERMPDLEGALRAFGSTPYAADDAAVYWAGKVLTSADPNTFTVPDPDDYYALDQTAVYYDGEIIAGADPKTFELERGSLGDTPYDAKDKNAYYYFGVDAREYEDMYDY